MDVTQLFTRLKTLGVSLTPAQRVSLLAAFVAVVAIVGASTYWVGRGNYTLLFADLDPEAAADVIGRLKAEKVAYQLDPGGRAVRVPAARADELRLEFASQGLPSSGRIGFEIFDRTAFGATEFLEQVNYRRALEGEIARTISSLSEVAGARVHIAMARASLFASREQPAKASVVLKLRNNRPLAPPTAQGIANLVAAAVEGLRPEAVVILDTFGRPLVRPPSGEDEPLGGAQMERQQRIERDLTAKVVALLEPVVGAAGVRVNVSARLDARSEEATEETWDPEASVVRSRQVSGDVSSFSAAQGVAGARANLPAPGGAQPAATPPPVSPPSSAGRGSETTNYEISRVTRHTVRPRGDIARLSVAVILDNESVTSTQPDGKVTRTTQARPADELQKIHGLVAAAVGFDPDRGDLLTVENVPFEEIPVEEPVTPGLWERVGPQVMEGLRILALVLVALFAFLFVVRPLMRRTATATTSATASGLPNQLPRTVQDLEGDIEAQLDALVAGKSAEQRKLPVLKRRLSEMSVKEPEHAARLLRTWMGEDPH